MSRLSLQSLQPLNRSCTRRQTVHLCRPAPQDYMQSASKINLDGTLFFDRNNTFRGVRSCMKHIMNLRIYDKSSDTIDIRLR